MQLTPKQEKFCLVYAEIGNASEAYRQSYDVENMKPQTIKKRASELLAHRAIAGTLEILSERAEEAFEVSVGLKKKKLFEHMNSDDRSSSIKAIDSLNKMDGHLAPTKNQNENKTTVVFNNDYSGGNGD